MVTFRLHISSVNNVVVSVENIAYIRLDLISALPDDRSSEKLLYCLELKSFDTVNSWAHP